MGCLVRLKVLEFLGNCLTVRQEMTSAPYRFAEEQSLIDEYVNSKYANQVLSLKCEEIAEILVTQFFIPQRRLEEAKSWSHALPNGSTRERLISQTQLAINQFGSTGVQRVPNNAKWVNTSATEKALKTDAQQYHYDRTMSFMVLSKTLSEDLEDVAVCRNEWITFQARIFFSGLGEFGAELNTLAMVVSDYIDYFLIQKKPAEATPQPTLVRPSLSKLSNYLVQNQKLKKLLSSDSRVAGLLDSGVLAHFSYAGTSRGDSSEEIFFTDAGVLFAGKRGKDFYFTPRQLVSSITVGSEDHIQYQGLSSSRFFYWILTINTTQYETYTRWIPMGATENSINASRRMFGPQIELISKFYDVDEGPSWHSSGGYTTSYGWYF